MGVAAMRTIPRDIAIIRLWHVPCSVSRQLRFMVSITSTAPEGACMMLRTGREGG
jgi:hypothetical protein